MKPTVYTFVAALISVFALFRAPAVQAATMLYMDTNALVQASDIVVVGEITDARVFIGAHDRITTEWTVQVRATLDGEHHEVVKFRQWAGELDGQVMAVPGDARITLGTQYVLFLRGDTPVEMYLSGLAQSAYTLHENAQIPAVLGEAPGLVQRAVGGRPHLNLDTLPMRAPVTRSFADIGLYDAATTEVHGLGTEVRLLADLVAEIRAAAQEQE